MVDMGLANLTSWFFFSMGALGLVVVDAGVWAGGLGGDTVTRCDLKYAVIHAGHPALV